MEDRGLTEAMRRTLFVENPATAFAFLPREANE